MWSSASILLESSSERLWAKTMSVGDAANDKWGGNIIQNMATQGRQF